MTGRPVTLRVRPRKLPSRVARWSLALWVLMAAPCLVPPRAEAQRAQGLELQELESQALNPGVPSNWNVAVGLGVASQPVYPGAGSERLRADPLIAIGYRDLLTLTPAGLAYKAIRIGGFFAGPVLGYQGYRHESADPHLAGLGDIPASLSAGVFAGFRAGRWEARVSARQAITHAGNGLEGLAELDYRIALLPHRTLLSLGPQVSFGDGAFNRTWFGVSSGQSAASGLPLYVPPGGVDGYGLHASLSSALTEHVVLRAFASARRLTNLVIASPLVERRTEGVLGAGLAYRF